jgi:hypothetical protein
MKVLFKCSYCPEINESEMKLALHESKCEFNLIEGEKPTNEEYRSIGEAFLKELRAMPYDNSMVGKSFVILPKVQFKEQETSKPCQEQDDKPIST